VAFDLLFPKLEYFMSLRRGPLVRNVIKIGLLVFKIMFTNLVIDERTDGHTNGRTDRQPENLMPPRACQSGMAEAQTQSNNRI